MSSKRRRAVQAARLTASAFAASAAVAVAAGTTAAGDSRGQSDGPSASQARFKEPKVKLKDGRLEIEGKKAEDDRIALFLKPGDPGTLQVDVDGDGTADESFPRAEITSISVDYGTWRRHRADRREQWGLHRHHPDDDGRRRGQRHVVRRCRCVDAVRRARRRPAGRRLRCGEAERRRRLRPDRRQPRQRRRLHGRRRRHVRLGSGRRQRHDRGPGRPRHDALQRGEHGGEGRPLGERVAAQVLPRCGHHHDGHGRCRAGRLHGSRCRGLGDGRRPQRHGRRRGERRPRCERRRRRRRGRQRRRQGHERQRRRLRERRQRRREHPRPRGSGEHHGTPSRPTTR